MVKLFSGLFLLLLATHTQSTPWKFWKPKVKSEQIRQNEEPLISPPLGKNRSIVFHTSYYLDLQVKDVVGETMETGDVAHQRIRVMKAKEIVMGQQMEEVMMDTKDVKEILCAAVTIAKSSVSTFMRKTIAVRSLQARNNQHEKILTYQEHHLNQSLVQLQLSLINFLINTIRSTVQRSKLRSW